MDETLSEILLFLRDYVDLDVGPDADLFGQHGLDSLQVNELVRFIEERWGVAVPGKRITALDFGTPRRVAALVADLRG